MVGLYHGWAFRKIWLVCLSHHGLIWLLIWSLCRKGGEGKKQGNLLNEIPASWILNYLQSVLNIVRDNWNTRVNLWFHICQVNHEIHRSKFWNTTDWKKYFSEVTLLFCWLPYILIHNNQKTDHVSLCFCTSPMVSSSWYQNDLSRHGAKCRFSL